MSDIPIPGDLLKRLHRVLRTCGPFIDDRTLEATFADARINIWYYKLPSAANRDERIKTVVDFLRLHYDTDGQNALVLFLRVISDQTSSNDMCQLRLNELAHQLEGILGGSCFAMTQNPFTNRAAIKDPLCFFDRNKETKQVLAMLGKGQSVSLLGPRKIGKTSLLFHIMRSEVLAQYRVDSGRNLFVYVDCQLLVNYSANELYVRLLQIISSAAMKYGHHIPIQQKPTSFYEFEVALGQVFKRNLKLALLLDEFEILSRNDGFKLALLSGLRSLATNYDIAYLTVSQRHLFSFTEAEYSPFFNYFVPINLGLFGINESRHLVETLSSRVNVSFSPQTMDFILELSGCHPFFLQLISYWALDRRLTKEAPLNSQDLKHLSDSVFWQAEPHFIHYWEHLSGEEKYVLSTLSLTQNTAMYRKEREELRRLCLIIRKNDHHSYFSPLFRDFVRQQEVDQLVQAGPFVLDSRSGSVLLREQVLTLNPNEFNVFSYLMRHLECVVTNEELDREAVASSEDPETYAYVDNQRVKSVIKRLRSALGEDGRCIQNVRGIGYKLSIQSEA